MEVYLVCFFAWVMVGHLVVYRVTEYSPAIGLTLMRVAGKSNRKIRTVYLVTKYMAVLLWPLSGWITLLGTKISYVFMNK